MALQIVWTSRATKSVQKVVDYLDATWNERVTDTFIDQLNTHLALLQSGVLNGKKSKFKNVESLLITKHNRLYFRKKPGYIQILLLFDVRQNPAKNPYE